MPAPAIGGWSRRAWAGEETPGATRTGAQRRGDSGEMRMEDPIPHFKINDEVAGLRIMGELGMGAASVVYWAQDPKTKEVWSLKHVHRGSAKDDRFLQQAIYEYKVASDLDHPNIRKIIRMEKQRRQIFQLSEVFLVMELLDGVSLDRTPPKTIEDAVALFVQVADALKHMHSRGYVHADMKPNNIMMVQGLENGKPVPQAKIIDLGQSCKEGTVKSRIQGTPDYIAPEQVHRRAITAKTDVYNLGATMYALLTGRTVPTAMAKGDSLMGRLDDSMVPRPDPASSHNPRIPTMLNELIMTCVEIDPADRPANMTYVVERLQLILGMMRAKPDANSASPLPSPTRPGMPSNSASGIGELQNDGSTVVGVRFDEPGKPG